MKGLASLDPYLTIEVDCSSKYSLDFAKDVLEGLSALPKRIPPRYFYDERGSKLFEQICRLPEYYITRTEHTILRAYADEIIACSEGSMVLVELGSGSSFKTRTLIEALIGLQGFLHYFPIDISESMVVESARQLLHNYSKLKITALIAEYNAGIHRIAEQSFAQKMVLFLGSNLGNFEPQNARDFLGKIRSELNDRDTLLLGTDMQKDASILEPAYDDSQGITADFNLNLLRRINNELAGKFDVTAFSHLAYYNRDHNRVEMHLRSQKTQDVYIGQLQKSFHFAAGETIHTENSYKYSFSQIDEMATHAGFDLVNRWQDDRGYCTLHLLAPARNFESEPRP